MGWLEGVWGLGVRAAAAWLLLALALLLPAPLAAANDAALKWLGLQRQADGGYALPADLAAPAQAAAEALRTLHPDPGQDRAASLQYLDAAAVGGPTEYLARAVIARAEAGAADPALRAALEARQNPDGGFGGGPGFASTALDTAYALAALPDGGGASAALAYLRARQRPDGGFALDDQAQGSAYATAAALMALHAHRLGYDLAQPLARAAGFLLAARGQDGGWGEDFETAWALLALAPATTDRAALAPAAQAVADAQQADGSWGGDVYRTALAARALLAVGKAGGGQSAAGTVTDRVADQAGGLSAETAADGRFSLPGLAPGELSVGFALAGYADAARAAMLEAGQRLDLGTVALAGGVRV